jgi:hypothetical protein
MILGFKKQFVPLIKNGSKIHTIREDKKERWKQGNKIHFATGVRTKNYQQFGILECSSTQRINIIYNYPQNHAFNSVNVFIDGVMVPPQKIEELAQNDGFETVDDFFKWFNTDFDGKIIHWTDLKY